MTEIWIPGAPPTVTQQQHRVVCIKGRPHFVPTPKLRETRKHFAEVLGRYDGKTYTEPVTVEITWIFPYRHSERKAVTSAGRVIPKYTRPDVDNLNKALLDELTHTGIIQDDAIVSELVTRKCWGPHPGIKITIDDLNRVGFEREIKAGIESVTKCGSK